ncbi:MAG: DUF3179 domain-containing protein [Marinilabilia sp.]
MKTTTLIATFYVLFLLGCSDDISNASETSTGDEWLIPANEVLEGGPGKDGIPALTTPDFIPASEASYLSGNDLILGFVDGDDIRAYPHAILDWHEIINDQTPNHVPAIIYCPLTGTGIGWNRKTDGNTTTFGVSGLLYNSNIIPYDRATDSNWLQLHLKSVNGKLAGDSAETFNLIETTWKTWKEMFPSTRVVSTNTGYNRSYGEYPYGNYKENNELIFSVNNEDDRLHKKERVLAVIIGEKARAYRFEDLGDNGNLFTDEFAGAEMVITGNTEASLMVAFKSTLSDGTSLEFEIIEDQLPAILTDREGNTWDVTGKAIDGPRKGEKLEPVTQIMGYWFGFAAFYPEIELY